MSKNCLCIRCACKRIKEKVEENYIINHDQIVRDLYNYFSIVDFEDEKQLESDIPLEIVEQNYSQNLEKFRNVQQMIENGDDENIVLMELEILEGSVDFLQRHQANETNRRLGKVFH